MRKRIQKDHIIAVALISGLLLFVVAAFLVFGGQRDNEGAANADCERFPLASLAGPSGWVISGHITGCSPPAASVAGYIYIHPKDAKESIEYLAFRYVDSSKGDDVTFRWIDERTVAVRLQSAGPITRMQKSIGPIQVVYDIGTIRDHEQSN
jgi:hypothetical protein